MAKCNLCHQEVTGRDSVTNLCCKAQFHENCIVGYQAFASASGKAVTCPTCGGDPSKAPVGSTEPANKSAPTEVSNGAGGDQNDKKESGIFSWIFGEEPPGGAPVGTSGKSTQSRSLMSEFDAILDQGYGNNGIKNLKASDAEAPQFQKRPEANSPLPPPPPPKPPRQKPQAPVLAEGNGPPSRDVPLPPEGRQAPTSGTKSAPTEVHADLKTKKDFTSEQQVPQPSKAPVPPGPDPAKATPEANNSGPPEGGLNGSVEINELRRQLLETRLELDNMRRAHQLELQNTQARVQQDLQTQANALEEEKRAAQEARELADKMGMKVRDTEDQLQRLREENQRAVASQGSSLSSIREQYEHQLQKVTSQAAHFEQVNAELKEQLERVEASHKTMESAAKQGDERVRAQIEQLTGQVQLLERENGTLSTAHDEAVAELKAKLLSDRAAHESVLQAKDVELEALRAKVKELGEGQGVLAQEKVSALEAKFAEQVKGMEEQHAKDLKELRLQYEQRQAEFNATTANMAALQGQVQKSAAARKELTDRFTVALKQRDQQIAHVTAKNKQLGAVATQLSTQNKALKVTAQKLKDVLKQFKAKLQQTGEAAQTSAALQAENTQLKTAIQGLEEQVRSLNEEINRARDAEQQLSAAHKAREDESARCARLQADLTAMESKLAEASRTASAVSELRDQLDQSESDRSRLSEEALRLRATIATMEETSAENAMNHKEELEDVRRELHLAQQEARGASQEVERLMEARDNFSSIKRELESKVQAAMSERDRAISEHERLVSAHRQELEAERQAKQQIEHRLRQDHEADAHALHDLRSKNKMASERLLVLQRQCQDLKNLHDDAVAVRDEKAKEAEDLRKQAEMHQRDAEAHRTEKENFRSQIETLTRNLQMIQASVRDRDVSLQRAEASRNQLAQESPAWVQLSLDQLVPAVIGELRDAKRGTSHWKTVADQAKEREAELRREATDAKQQASEANHQAAEAAREAEAAKREISIEKTATEKAKQENAELMRRLRTAVEKAKENRQNYVKVAHQCKALMTKLKAAQPLAQKLKATQAQLKNTQALSLKLKAALKSALAAVEKGKGMQATVDAERKRADSFEKQLQESKDMQARHQQEVDRLKETIDKSRADMAKEKSKYAETLAAAESRASAAETRVSEAETRALEAEEKVTNAEEKASEAEEKASKALEEIQRVKTAEKSGIADLKTQISTLEEAKKAAEDSESSLKQKLESAEKDAGETKEALTKAEKDVEELRTQLDGVRKEKSELETELQEQTETAEDYDEKNTILSGENDQLQQDLEAAKTTLKAEKEAREKEVAELKQSIANLEELEQKRKEEDEAAKGNALVDSDTFTASFDTSEQQALQEARDEAVRKLDEHKKQAAARLAEVTEAKAESDDALSSVQGQLRQLEDDKASLERELAGLKARLEALKEDKDNDHGGKVSELWGQVAEAKKASEQSQHEQKAIAAELEAVKHSRDAHAQTIEELRSSLAEKDQERVDAEEAHRSKLTSQAEEHKAAVFKVKALLEAEHRKVQTLEAANKKAAAAAASAAPPTGGASEKDDGMVKMLKGKLATVSEKARKYKEVATQLQARLRKALHTLKVQQQQVFDSNSSTTGNNNDVSAEIAGSRGRSVSPSGRSSRRSKRPAQDSSSTSDPVVAELKRRSSLMRLQLDKAAQERKALESQIQSLSRDKASMALKLDRSTLTHTGMVHTLTRDEERQRRVKLFKSLSNASSIEGKKAEKGTIRPPPKVRSQTSVMMAMMEGGGDEGSESEPLNEEPPNLPVPSSEGAGANSSSSNNEMVSAELDRLQSKIGRLEAELAIKQNEWEEAKERLQERLDASEKEEKTARDKAERALADKNKADEALREAEAKAVSAQKEKTKAIESLEKAKQGAEEKSNALVERASAAEKEAADVQAKLQEAVAARKEAEAAALAAEESAAESRSSVARSEHVAKAYERLHSLLRSWEGYDKKERERRRKIDEEREKKEKEKKDAEEKKEAEEQKRRESSLSYRLFGKKKVKQMHMKQRKSWFDESTGTYVFEGGDDDDDTQKKKDGGGFPHPPYMASKLPTWQQLQASSPSTGTPGKRTTKSLTPAGSTKSAGAEKSSPSAGSTSAPPRPGGLAKPKSSRVRSVGSRYGSLGVSGFGGPGPRGGSRGAPRPGMPRARLPAPAMPGRQGGASSGSAPARKPMVPMMPKPKSSAPPSAEDKPPASPDQQQRPQNEKENKEDAAAAPAPQPKKPLRPKKQMLPNKQLPRPRASAPGLGAAARKPMAGRALRPLGRPMMGNKKLASAAGGGPSTPQRFGRPTPAAAASPPAPADTTPKNITPGKPVPSALAASPIVPPKPRALFPEGPSHGEAGALVVAKVPLDISSLEKVLGMKIYLGAAQQPLQPEAGGGDSAALGELRSRITELEVLLADKENEIKNNTTNFEEDDGDKEDRKAELTRALRRARIAEARLVNRDREMAAQSHRRITPSLSSGARIIHHDGKLMTVSFTLSKFSVAAFASMFAGVYAAGTLGGDAMFI